MKEVRETLTRRGLSPLKQLGQNFLVDANLCKWIAERIEVDEGEHVIEVGPGLGALTGLLLEKNVCLTALEIDKGLSCFLRERFEKVQNFTLVEGDALRTLPKQTKAAAVVGNLPYNISTPLVMGMVTLPEPPPVILFTLQREVGERYAAQPGEAEYGAVSIFLQTFYEIQVLRVLSGAVFYPEPKVESVVVRMKRRSDFAGWECDRRKEFNLLLKKAFAQRRKKLRNTIGWDSDLRPQQLDPVQWQELFETLSAQQEAKNDATC